MEWWGAANQLEFIDKPDALTIRATSVQRRGDLILPFLLALGFAVAPWFGGGWLILLALGGLSAALFISWFMTSITEIRVTDRRIEVRSSGNTLSVNWSEIAGLEYRAGGEGEASGLYARQTRWQGLMLTSQLNQDECNQVIDAIYRRFPYAKMADDRSGGFLRDPEIISLGLSRKDL
jgi:hypothetical protein